MGDRKTLSGIWGGDAKLCGPIIPDKKPLFFEISARMADIDGHLIGDMSARSFFRKSSYEEDGISMRGRREGLSVSFSDRDGVCYSGIVTPCFNRISGTVSFVHNGESISGPFVFYRRGFSLNADQRIIRDECILL